MATSPVTLDFSKAVPIPQSNVQLDFSKAVPIAPAQQPGFWENLGHTFGIGTQEEAQRQQYASEHPILNALEVAGGPAVQAGKMIYGQGKQTLGEIGQGINELRQGNPAAAGVHAVGAVPLVGPALNKMAAEAPATTPGQSYLSRVASAATPGNVGTALGTAAQVALMVLGAADQVAPGRPTIPNPPVGKAVTAVGEAAQDAGTGLINKTVGTLKSDFKRGANPGRGYLETDNGPSFSMASMADKANTALESVGNKLGTAYKAADATGVKIPVDVVAQEMAKPLQKAIALETGPGGTGNLAPIRAYMENFGPVFEKAAQNGGFLPSEVFDIKRSIAQNTNWSDPTQFNLKSVRQQQAGALSGILSDAIPETKGLNQMYQDLTKFEARAQERANTGSRPLTAHIYKGLMLGSGALAGTAEGGGGLGTLGGLAAGAALDSVPVKTTLATVLYRGGKAVSSLGRSMTPSESSPMEGVAPNDLGYQGTNYKPGNPQLPPPGPPTDLTRVQRAGYSQQPLGTAAEMGSGPNNITPKGLPSAYSAPQLPPSTAGRVPVPPSPPPPLNQATARMRVKPTQFSVPSVVPERGTISVSPNGEVSMPNKGQLPAPSTATTTAKPLSGRALWVQRGAQNLSAHGVSDSDIEAFSKTNKGKDLIVVAGGIPPGSMMMKNLVKQIRAAK